MHNIALSYFLHRDYQDYSGDYYYMGMISTTKTVLIKWFAVYSVCSGPPPNALHLVIFYALWMECLVCFISYDSIF